MTDCRYWLEHTGLRGDPNRWCVFVMLNPSTADITEDDPTIRRCKYFTEREDYGNLGVVNLWPERATKPMDLTHKLSESQLKVHLQTLRTAIKLSTLLIAAWGTGAFRIRDDMLRHVQVFAEEQRKPLMCFGTTAAGYPKHPLYLPNNAKLIEYKGNQ